MKVYDDFKIDFEKFQRDLLYFQYKEVNTNRSFRSKELFLKGILDEEDLYMHKILKMFKEKYLINDHWSISNFPCNHCHVLKTLPFFKNGSAISLFLHRNPETNHYIYNFKEKTMTSIKNGQYIIYDSSINNQETPCILLNGSWHIDKKGFQKYNPFNYLDNLWKIDFGIIK